MHPATRQHILVYHDSIFEKHDTGQHPENAARLRPAIAVIETLSKGDGLRRPGWQPATLDRVQCVHTAEYISELREFVKSGGGRIEQDTVVSPTSFDVALMAAGAVCDAIERVYREESRTAFCLVRPPGHHATFDRPAGFCLFNNVAIGARLAIKELNCQRVLIVDWDVHHGDGTQAIFREDPDVGYFSMHRSPFYPFTGSELETGGRAGQGMTRNVPIEFGTPRDIQKERFQYELSSFAEQVKPDLILISAGFDAHKDDPVGSLGLEASDFADLTRSVMDIANRFANGRIVSVLEGGYNPVALAECVEQHLMELAR